MLPSVYKFITEYYMLRITIESDKPSERAVKWVLDMLKYQGVKYRITTGKILRDGKISNTTTFEKR